MKSIFFFLSIAFFALNSVFANPSTIAPTPTFGNEVGSCSSNFPPLKVKLSASTMVIVEVNVTMNSDIMTIGQNIHCRVRNNVYADGQVVIRTGSMAMGRITQIQPSTTNSESVIGIEMFSVQSVDGQQIALNGNEQLIKTRFTGETVVLHPMQPITCQIMDTTIVTVDN